MFFDGANSLGSPITVNNFTASLTINSLSAGTHQIQAVYSGDANDAGDNTTIPQVVNPAPAKVSIIPDPCTPGKTAVEIDGADSSETITVTKSGSSQGKVVVKINNVNKGTFSFTGSIIVRGNKGDDNISIDSAITRETFIFGGAGNDTVNGGGGSDVIVGGDGNDSINGNSGRDILLGSNGSDKLSGGNDDDILDAGTTNYDNDIPSLCKLQDEWTRTDKNYTFRVQHITQGGGKNGTVKLNASTTFSSKALKDTLGGGSGSDLFLAAMSGDKITDKTASETAINIGV
jgi:Ca2+-binding RTX toxin-like protein